MENNTNIQDKSYEWIVSAIDSSTNEFHIECCKKLIELFSNKFPEPIKEAELLVLMYERLNTINYSLK
jgi:hypothetical protein